MLHLTHLRSSDRRSFLPESPAQLRKVCPKVPRYTGTVKLSAAFLSFKVDPLKKAWLSVAWSMQAAQAIPQVGSGAAEARRTSQTKLARMMGVTRETMCRLIMLFSPAAAQWTEKHKEKNVRHLQGINERRKQATSPVVPPQVADESKEGMLSSATDTLFGAGLGGHGDTGAEATQSPAPDLTAGMPVFFHKSNSGVGMPLFYTEGISPELANAGHRNPNKKEDKHVDAANLAKAFGEKWFDSLSTWRNFVEADSWILSDGMIKTVRCICRKGQMKFNFQSDCGICGGKGYLDTGKPMGANPRIFMIVLELLGIKRFGSLQKTQAEMAEICGMSVGTISKCQDEWEHLGIIETIPGEVIYEVDLEGKPVLNNKGERIISRRFAQKLIWLPGRVLDDEIAEREKVRLNNACIVQAERAKLLALASERELVIKQLQESRRIHSELLHEWRGTQRRVESVWKEMRFRMKRANLHRDLHKALFPFYRE